MQFSGAENRKRGDSANYKEDSLSISRLCDSRDRQTRHVRNSSRGCDAVLAC